MILTAATTDNDPITTLFAVGQVVELLDPIFHQPYAIPRTGKVLSIRIVTEAYISASGTLRVDPQISYNVEGASWISDTGAIVRSIDQRQIRKVEVISNAK